MTGGGILSLSKVCSDPKKPESPSILTDTGQKSSTIFPLSSLTRAGFRPFMTQTACNTNFTGAGGLFIALISVISLDVNVSSALRASSRAGIASARSASTSALDASDFAAASAATASSAATTSLTFAVLSDSALTTTIISPTSLFFWTSLGCKSINSIFIPATDSSVATIFSTPFSYLSFKSDTCCRFADSNCLKVWMSSRNEVGVA
mmetsp:Transcript_52179/g.122068  ORF Transcript_52179/g.122068 Transcript_52179/m.122068 type:complete len:207 (-) Transcript_52179:3621-4241(-)